jgi:hypothetical protein
VLNFTRFWKFILLNLDYLCKRYKRNMKTEKNKKKGEEKKKRKENRTEQSSPAQYKSSPRPTRFFPNRFPLPLTGGPHGSGSPPTLEPPLFLSPRKPPCRLSPTPSRARADPKPAPLFYPVAPPCFPSHPHSRDAVKLRRFITETAQFRRRANSIPTTPWVPTSRFWSPSDSLCRAHLLEPWVVFFRTRNVEINHVWI